jgi:integrase
VSVHTNGHDYPTDPNNPPELTSRELHDFKKQWMEAYGSEPRPHGIYQRMLALGKRAGVPDAHPHRYRDTLAVDLLAKGANPYDVAKLLGDTVATVEKHYAPFVKELRDRARRIMENGEGLEKTDCTIITRSTAKVARVQ